MALLDDNYFMAIAYREAQKAFDADEVPVGAVIVYDGNVVAKAYNQCIQLKDPTAHAEVIAIGQAAGLLGPERLRDSILYVTMEPCIMCSGAVFNAGIKAVHFGVERDKEKGLLALKGSAPYSLSVEGGIYTGEIRALLGSFFAEKRQMQRLERWLSG